MSVAYNISKSNDRVRESRQNVASLIEAYLYQQETAVNISKISKLTGFSLDSIKYALAVIRDKYNTVNSGLMLEWENDMVQIVLKKQCQEWINNLNETDQEKLTMILDEYLYVIDSRGYSPETVKEKKYKLKNFFKAVNKQIEDITEKDIKFYLMAERKKGNSNNTIANKFSTLKAFFNWLVIEEIVDKHPMRKMEKPKETSAPPKYLTYDELEKLREKAEDLLDRTLIEVLYSSGIRVSEAVALNWSDINFENKSLIVQKGKGGKTRKTFLSVKAVMLLKKYKKTRKDDNEWVFNAKWRGDNRMSRYSIGRRIKKLGKLAGITKAVTPHRLRHSIATHLLNKGAKETGIQQLLGHSNINTTMRYARADLNNTEHEYRRLNP